jgi:hypothetical protein
MRKRDAIVYCKWVEDIQISQDPEISQNPEFWYPIINIVREFRKTRFPPKIEKKMYEIWNE